MRIKVLIVACLASVVGLALTTVAGPSTRAAAAPALAGGSLAPAPDATIQATTCHAEIVAFSGARGSCNDPAPHLSFKIVAHCEHSITGAEYEVESPLVPTSQVAFVNCTQGFSDRMLDAHTVIVQTGPAPDLPVIHFYFCEYVGNQSFNCRVTASNWTKIRWLLNGSTVSAWNNRTLVFGGCSGSTKVETRVSNSDGTVKRTSFLNCSGPAP